MLGSIRRRGFFLIVPIIFFVLILLGLVVMLGLATGSNQLRGGALDKWVGGSGGGCYLSDAGFKDTSIADNPDEVVNKLATKYSRVSSSEDTKNKIRQIIKKGKEMGINPAVPLSIWYGEQGFANPEKAFGYGYRDSGTVDGVSNWDAQLRGVYGAIQDAISNKGSYNNKNQAIKYNDVIWTRLFYHYTTAMRLVYEQSGYMWDENKQVKASGCGSNGDCGKPHGVRMQIIRLLSPGAIACNVGNKTASCSGITSKMLNLTNEYKSRTGVPKVIILHYTATDGSWTGDEGQKAFNFFQSCVNGQCGNDHVFVQYFIDRDGKIFQLTPSNVRVNGAAGMNGGEETFKKHYGDGISINIENDGNFNSNCSGCKYTKKQLEANISLIKCLMSTYNIPKSNVISHEYADQLTGRNEKSDPGEEFMREVLKKL